MRILPTCITTFHGTSLHRCRAYTGAVYTGAVCEEALGVKSDSG
jgi:hypothetical protein